MTGKQHNGKIIIWAAAALFCVAALVLIFLWGSQRQNNTLLGCRLVSDEELDEIAEGLSANLSGFELELNGQAIEYCIQLGGYLTYCADLDSPRGALTASNGATLWISQPYTDGSNQTLCRCVAKSGEQYAELNLILTDLPVLAITTDEEYDFINEWQPGLLPQYCKINAFIKQPEEYCTFVFFGMQNDTLDTQSGRLSFHMRGLTSITFEKKPLRLHMLDASGGAKQRRFLNLGKDNDWILNSLYTDSSKMRDRLSLEVWNCMAESTENEHDSSSSMAQVEVLLNGRYIGVYGLQTVLDASTQQLNKTTDYLYAPMSYHEMRDDVISGIYSAGDTEYETITENTHGKIISYPEDAEGNLWQPLLNYSNAITWNYVYNGKISMSEIQAVADLENITDFYLWKLLTGADDNGVKNCYYAGIYDTTAYENLRFIRIPWDTNYTFGDNYATSLVSPKTLTVNNPGWSYQDFVYDPVFSFCYVADSDIMSSLLYERWQRLKSIVDADSLTEYARQLFEELDSSGGIDRDYGIYRNGGDFDIEAFCSQIYARYEYMDERINEIANDPETEYWRQRDLLLKF